MRTAAHSSAKSVSEAGGERRALTVGAAGGKVGSPLVGGPARLRCTPREMVTGHHETSRFPPPRSSRQRAGRALQRPGSGLQLRREIHQLQLQPPVIRAARTGRPRFDVSGSAGWARKRSRWGTVGGRKGKLAGVSYISPPLQLISIAATLRRGYGSGTLLLRLGQGARAGAGSSALELDIDVIYILRPRQRESLCIGQRRVSSLLRASSARYERNPTAGWATSDAR